MGKMADIKLFRYSDAESRELVARQAQLEKSLQHIIEKHMQDMLGIRLLGHEYPTGRNRRGIIDSLGLDENNCPVIIEYKRANNDNIICQGLYYLDWLMDHQAEFILLARNVLGEETAENIEFDGTRIICIASAFSRYDEQAVMQIDRNIELVRYRLYDDDLILLEMLNTSISHFLEDPERQGGTPGSEVGMPAPLQERVRSMNAATEFLYLELLAFAENLGEDVSIKFLKHYIALTRFKNFTCIQPLRNSLKLWLNLDPGQVPLEDGFSRDVSDLGHVASGNLLLEIRDKNGFIKAQPLIELAYQQN